MRLSDMVHKAAPGRAACQFDSSQQASLTSTKPGGTAIITVGAMVGRLEPQGRRGDSMGRWSYMTFRRSSGMPLTVISVYQVCKDPTYKQGEAGHTAWHQQRNALDLQERDEHPRSAFIADLLVFIKSLQNQHHGIIVGGDWNETLEDPRSGLLRLATQTGLCDPWLAKYPHHPSFETRQPGSRRIDSVLLSPELVPCLTRIGYTPVSRIVNSDHRGLLLEFDETALFRGQASPLPAIISRGVKSKDKAGVTTYIKRLHDHLTANNAFAKRAPLDLDQLSPSEVETLDALIGQGGDHADGACRPRRSEWFSRTLSQARMTVQLLQAQLSALTNGQDRRVALMERAQSIGLDFDVPINIPATRIALKKAKHRLRRQCAPQSEKIRRNELHLNIEVADQRRNTLQAKILRKLNKCEESMKTHRIIAAMKNKTGQIQRLDRIDIPASASWPAPDDISEDVSMLEDPKSPDCTEWRTVTDPSQIEFYLMLRNRLHFGQAQGTPFTVPPLSNVFDWGATTTAAENVLTGEYSSQVTIAHCAKLLDECRAVTPLDSVSNVLTMEEFKGKIQAWREATTTSPSSRHLGRYKALFARGHYDESVDEEGAAAFKQKQQDIAMLIVAIMNYCIRNQYVLNRWRVIVNTMIFKEPGVYRIHRLRVIHIYEADFNLLLAVKWRGLLHHADRHGLINEGQYGGRPRCEAQSLTFLEELKYDLCYLSRRSLLNFDNDAMSCYDRIIMALASLINRKYGQHRSIVAVHARTLEEARYKIRTALGISEVEYSHCEAFPLHGSGQGAGNSPSIWLFILSTLFDIHSDTAFGATFSSPDGSLTTRLTMIGFVDDSTGTCNDFQPQTQCSLDELVDRMQHDAQLWNDLLFCSGGRLELGKCSFHVLHFNFLPDGTPRPMLTPIQRQIQIRDSLTGEMILIPQMIANKAHKTLGHYKAPADPTQKLQLNTLIKKAKALSVLIGTSPVSRFGAFLAYRSIYEASFRFVLPQCFFPRKVLDKAQSHSFGILIAKSGYARTTAAVLIFAPRDYGGGGFVRWFVLQGEGQIQLFLKHWRTKTIVSRILRIAVSWAQWQAGISTSFLFDVVTPLPYLECRWLKSLQEFLHHCGGQLRLDRTFVVQPERRNDIYIMDYARQCGLFDATDLKYINYCRLYLHVTTVSELFNAAGTRILQHMLECKRPLWFHDQQITTLQKRPSQHQIKYRWARLCREWCKHDGTIAESLTLGDWVVTTSGSDFDERAIFNLDRSLCSITGGRDLIGRLILFTHLLENF